MQERAECAPPEDPIYTKFNSKLLLLHYGLGHIEEKLLTFDHVANFRASAMALDECSLRVWQASFRIRFPDNGFLAIGAW